VSEVIISRVPYRPIQKGIAACLVKQALFIAALHRNIALQQTTDQGEIYSFLLTNFFKYLKNIWYLVQNN